MGKIDKCPICKEYLDAEGDCTECDYTCVKQPQINWRKVAGE